MEIIWEMGNPCKDALEDWELKKELPYLRFYKQNGKLKPAFCKTQLETDLKKGKVNIIDIMGKYDDKMISLQTKKEQSGRLTKDEQMMYNNIHKLYMKFKNEYSSSSSTKKRAESRLKLKF